MTGGSIESTILQVTRQALVLTIFLSGIPIILSMVVGVIVSVFQAATQIQEQTLTFVPKLVVVFATILVAGYWMMAQLVKFSTGLLTLIPKMGSM